jgi:SAM-dependent methyltransferase
MAILTRLARILRGGSFAGAAARTRLRFAHDLRGRGLEIGALQNPMPLPRATHVTYSDVLTVEQLDRVYPGSTHPDIISNSERFPTVPDDSFDFVVANHVLEHVCDPIGALREWHRILRQDGHLLMAVPDKRLTFDHRRRRTPLAHLVADHRSDLPEHERNRCHLLEWAQFVEGLRPGTPEFDRWISDQLARGYSVAGARSLLLVWIRKRLPSRLGT